MRTSCLFIDESGDANPKVRASEVYILSGCMVDEYTREKLKIHADQIKFKYWSRTDIVLHSRDIGRKAGEFGIFNDAKIFDEFQKDLFYFLSKNYYQMFFVLVNKENAFKANWNSQKVYEDTAFIMIKNFVLALLAQDNMKGRIVVESATSLKDFFFHKAASHFLSRGIPELGVSYRQVQDALTEISFVTKKNHDIEEQIADLLAFAAKLKFTGKKQTDMNPYEKNILKVLRSKVFTMDPQTGARKKKYYSQIDSFKEIPI